MAFTKTRIWRGGVAGTPVPSADDALELSGDALAHESRSSLDEAVLFDRTALDLASPGPLKGFEASYPSPLATTRFLPIEELFPEQQARAQEPFALTPVSRGGRRSWLERLSVRSSRYESVTERPRWLRRVLLITLAVAIVASAISIPVVRRELAAAHVSAFGAKASFLARAPEAQPSVDSQRTSQAASRSVSNEQSVPSAGGSSRPKPQGLERSAVDALISGDLTRAAQLYGRLADGAPREPVYREARRILSSQSAPR